MDCLFLDSLYLQSIELLVKHLQRSNRTLVMALFSTTLNKSIVSKFSLKCKTTDLLALCCRVSLNKHALYSVYNIVTWGSTSLYLTEIHDDALMNLLPQVSSEDLDQRDLERGDFTMHEDSSEVQLHLETHIYLQEHEENEWVSIKMGWGKKLWTLSKCSCFSYLHWLCWL